ncbi:hypothetical protein AN958_00019 [Leucoagaricus sp. SymC.cos]|nr:hypothetical protein AN958_00019 [Leucoagaricus sp. SymC.cos]
MAVVKAAVTGMVVKGAAVEGLLLEEVVAGGAAVERVWVPGAIVEGITFIEIGVGKTAIIFEKAFISIKSFGIAGIAATFNK